MLTKNEKMLIADALNGCGMFLDNDPHYLAMMTGDHGALADADITGHDAWDRIRLTGRVCSGLEHEIYDAIRLNRLDEKWNVDGRALVNTIASMSPADRARLIQIVADVWNRNDEHFERDLESAAI